MFALLKILPAAKGFLIWAAILAACGFGTYLVKSLKDAGAARVEIARQADINEGNVVIQDALKDVNDEAREREREIFAELEDARYQYRTEKTDNGELKPCPQNCLLD